MIGPRASSRSPTGRTSPSRRSASRSTRSIVVVEAVEKPGNLGAILRSADGAGADALSRPTRGPTCSTRTRSGPASGRSSRSRSRRRRAPRRWPGCRARGIRIVVARVDGAALYTETDLRGPLAIVLGSEATGLSAAWAGPDVVAVRLPMLGAADSLNVSAAAAVLLYEARRQRGSR